MARVPLQQTPEVGLEIGSTPQFTGGRIEPVKDTVTAGLQRFSKAQRDVADIAIKLQEEYNDAQALELANELDEKIEEEKNKYLTLQGGNAVATVDKDNNVTVYDQSINNIKTQSEEIGEKASNDQIKFLYENMALVKIKNATSRMTQHSITQQRNHLEAENTTAIDIQTRATIQSAETWKDDEGAFKMNYIAGLQRINEKALLKGWEINPEDGPISSQYMNEVSKYNKTVFEGVIDKFNREKNYKELREFRDSLENLIKDPREVAKIKVLTNEKHNNFCAEKICNNVISNNTNQNDGQYLSQFNLLNTLDSNNNIDNNNGGSVDDGFNSNDELIDTTNKTISEKIELLEKIKNQSKFYDPETKTRLIPQHQPTHLFAIQRLGVKKADSLYTKAKSQIDIDTKKYKEDATYAKKINEQIIDNYNKLIVEESNKIYGEGEYAITVANDLEVIKKGIDYDFTGEELNIDPVTGLRPLEDLKQELKDTIRDPKKLKFAIEDLEIKYDKIKTERESIYNEAFVNAKEIAFAEKGGWKNLEANGIDINNFREEDQKILKNGHPEKSDIDTLIMLDRDPANLGDNLTANLHKISRLDFLELQDYAKTKLNSDDKVLAVTIDNDMLDLTLKEHDLQFIKNGRFDKDDYLQLKGAWKKLIDEEQRRTDGKISRETKQKLLDQVLTNTVVYDYGAFQGDHKWPIAIVDKKQQKNTYVKVGGRTIWLKDINDFQRERIIEKILDEGRQVTEQLIAEMWVFGGRSKINNEEDWRKYNLGKELSLTSSMQ